MKTSSYLPKGDEPRLTWLINFNNKMVDTYAAILGITPAQLLIILNGLKMFTYILACVTASEKFYHTMISFKDGLNAKVIGTVVQPIPVYVAPPSPPATTVPFGFFAWLMVLIAQIKTNDDYSTEMGTDLGIIGSSVAVDWSKAKPSKVKVASNAGAVAGSYLKGQASGARIESMRGAETVFTTLTNVSKAKFIDSRPNLIAGQPEKRQYRIWYLVKDNVVGLVSDIITITVEA